MRKKGSWLMIEYVPVPENPGKEMRIHLMTSPYDIPEAFRFRDVEGQLRVEFKYIDSSSMPPAGKLKVEGVEEKILDNNLRVYVGRNTKRLMAIELEPIGAVGDVSVQIHNVIDELSRLQDLREQVDWNFKAAREAIDSKVRKFGRELLQNIPVHAH